MASRISLIWNNQTTLILFGYHLKEPIAENINKDQTDLSDHSPQLFYLLAIKIARLGAG